MTVAERRIEMIGRREVYPNTGKPAGKPTCGCCGRVVDMVRHAPRFSCECRNLGACVICGRCWTHCKCSTKATL
jgi:hypothetical protein